MAAAAGIAGAVLIGGYFLNGYQATVPAFAGLANLTWFGWTVHHQPLIGQPDWLSLGLVALVTIVLFAIGVEAFSRRDLGVDEPHPVAGVPGGDPRPPRTDEPIVRRAPAAGPGLGDRRRRVRVRDRRRGPILR